MIVGMWLTSRTSPVHVVILNLAASLVCTPQQWVRSYGRRYIIGAIATII
ncbi:hypothetical protein LINGRAPRIM_LOCUS589 [Linum grandiflorum]